MVPFLNCYREFWRWSVAVGPGEIGVKWHAYIAQKRPAQGGNLNMAVADFQQSILFHSP